MPRYYLQLWNKDIWDRHRTSQNPSMRHTAGNDMGRVCPGDVVYLVANLKGKMFLGGRMTVGQCTDRAGAQRILKTKDLWDAKYHFIAADGPLVRCDLDRQVPDQITAQLLMHRANGIRPLKIRDGRLDPQTLRHLSELDRSSAKLLDDFLAAAPSPARADAAAPDTPPAYSIDDDFEAAEGRPWFGEHLRHERSSALVRRKKEVALARGELSCEVCGFDYESYFGPIGRGFIEVHHAVPLSSLKGETQTRLSDLILVCSCCHRMLHRGEDLLSPEELAERIDATTRRKA